MTITCYPPNMQRLRGPLELVTAPTLAVFTPEEAKSHCRIDQDVQDNDVARWVATATRHVERLSGRQLLTATYDLPLSGWWSGLLKLPKPPLQSVGFLKHYDQDETLTTVAAANYLVRTPCDQPGYVELHEDFDWPSLHARQFPVVLRFVCGWAAASSIPETFRNAVAMMCSSWNLNREASLVGTISKEIEFGVSALLDSEDMGQYA